MPDPFQGVRGPKQLAEVRLALTSLEFREDGDCPRYSFAHKPGLPASTTMAIFSPLFLNHRPQGAQRLSGEAFTTADFEIGYPGGKGRLRNVCLDQLKENQFTVALKVLIQYQIEEGPEGAPVSQEAEI